MASGYDGSIRIDTKIDSAGFNSGVKSMDSGISSMTSSLKKMAGAVGIAFGVSTLIKFGKSAIDTASDLQEVQNVVDTAFGSMAYKAEEFSSTTIEKFGMSELAAKQTSSTYMAMAKSMGIATDAASDMAINVAGLSGDVASFYNMDQSEAASKLKGIFTGETEALKEIGVVMTEDNLKAYALAQGMTESYSSMSQAEKVSLRYQYVMSALGDAQGDFAKTSDSWANQTRILSEKFKELTGIIGQGLLVLLEPVLQGLNNVLSAIISIAENIAAAFSEAFNGGSQLSETFAAIMASINGAWETYGAPVFELIKQAVFGTAETLQSIWNTVLKPIWENFMVVVDWLWTNHLQPLWDKLMEFVSSLIANATEIYNNCILPIVNWLVDMFGPAFSNTFNTILNVVGSVIGSIADILGGVITVIKGVINFLTGVFTGDWERAWQGIVQIFTGIFEGIEGVVKGVVNVIISFINGMLNAITLGVNTAISAINSLSFDVPSWVPGIGGQTWGFSIPKLTAPQIPMLATGAVIPPNSEFLAVLGDQKSGTNIETPLATMIQAFNEALDRRDAQGSAGKQAININFTGSLSQLVRVLNPYIEDENNRYSVNLIEG